MLMPVLRRHDETSELLSLDLNDVLFINIEDRNLVYHTMHDKYYHISKLSDLEDHLAAYGFETLDKTNIVNMNKIKKLDEQVGNIYFDEQPTKQSKFASIAIAKQKLLKQEIARKISENTEPEGKG